MLKFDIHDWAHYQKEWPNEIYEYTLSIDKKI